MRVYHPRTGASTEPFTRQTLMPSAANAAHTVLVVEDEATVRSIATRILQRLGYTVLEASNGREALRVLQQQHRPVDLVVSDVVMPEMGGGELIAQLEKLSPGIPVLVMSGYNDDAALRDRLRSQHLPFLQKPFTAREFAAAVEGAMLGAA